MLDLLVNSPLVSLEDTWTYLTFASETSVAAFIFHGIWTALVFGGWISWDTVKDKVSGFLQNLKDSTYGYVDYTSYTNDLPAVKTYLQYALYVTGALTLQDFVNYLLAKFAPDVAENLFFQIYQFGTTLVDLVLLGGA